MWWSASWSCSSVSKERCKLSRQSQINAQFVALAARCYFCISYSNRVVGWVLLRFGLFSVLVQTWNGFNLQVHFISFRKWQNREQSLLLSGSRNGTPQEECWFYMTFCIYWCSLTVWNAQGRSLYDDKNNRAAHISQKHYYQTRVTVLIVIFIALFHSGVLQAVL